MYIPKYTIDGVIPPYVGPDPARSSALMSPYKVPASEVVNRFAINRKRKEILGHWLRYREDLRRVGLTEGFQWLGGSFTEDKESRLKSEPNDLDLMVFYRRPYINGQRMPDADWMRLAQSIPLEMVKRDLAKQAYSIDLVSFIDLDSGINFSLESLRYHLLLFSHQRDSEMWKGMIEVNQADSTDNASLMSLCTQI